MNWARNGPKMVSFEVWAWGGLQSSRRTSVFLRYCFQKMKHGGPWSSMETAGLLHVRKVQSSFRQVKSVVLRGDRGLPEPWSSTESFIQFSDCGPHYLMSAWISLDSFCFLLPKSLAYLHRSHKTKFRGNAMNFTWR